jgi:hypothetical protein
LGQWNSYRLCFCFRLGYRFSFRFGFHFPFHSWFFHRLVS